MRLEAHTYKQREEIFSAAKQFFGEAEGGLGMKLGAEQGTQIQFFGGGQVWITVWPSKDGKSFRVDIDESEREDVARVFLEKVIGSQNK